MMAIGGTITFTGPEDVNGNPCTPGITPSCIIGPANGAPIYEVFSLTITTPTAPGGTWTVSVDTDYGTTIPSNATSIPVYTYLETSDSFGIGDILFAWNGKDYGLVLTPHDGYAAGDLYVANTLQTSAQVLESGTPTAIPSDEIPRPTLNVLLGAGGSQVGTGKITVTTNPGANGVNNGTYTITDSFTAPSNFLSSAFTVYDSSYDCANGYLTGGNGGFTLGAASPEPGSWLLILPGLVLLGVARMRKRRA